MIKMKTESGLNFSVTRNPCKLCSPLGACIVFRGIKNSMPLIHGGQGCATYIRRYLISHYREPVDIASSSFSETTTIFGGESNLIEGLENVISQYDPEFVGIATSCLAETIGDDVGVILNKFRNKHMGEKIPAIVHASTPSYTGTHMTGFHKAVKKVVETFAASGKITKRVNIFPGFVSPADIRLFKEICDDFGLPAIVFPDYSDTLDGPIWDDYRKIPEGGTGLDEIRSSGSSMVSIEFCETIPEGDSAAYYLERKFGVKRLRMPMPIGIRQTDAFMNAMSEISGIPVPVKYANQRGRLIDSYADAHKYLFGKKAIVYGEEDLVISISNFLLETGVIPVLCASGGNSGKMEEAIHRDRCRDDIKIFGGVDFSDISDCAGGLEPDVIIGNSKGYRIARGLNIPLVRVGFPVHDRIGGQRILLLGYSGTQDLFDRITNALMESKQENSEVGYSYI
jgi:nitrogenase molybdenum-iron protein NifN